MNANSQAISISVDPLNVMTFDVPPLTDDLMNRIQRGKSERTRILDGSHLEQHDGLEPYAVTHVTMKFSNEDDIVKCARLLQWSDERMRSRREPTILWKWQEAFRDGDEVSFSVAWYSQDFFESRKDSFADPMHQSYYGIFAMTPGDLGIRHEICS